MRCPNCDSLIHGTPADRRCPDCGAWLPDEAPAQPQAAPQQAHFCPDCGTQTNSRFCPNCGKSLQAAPTAQPQYTQPQVQPQTIHIHNETSGFTARCLRCSSPAVSAKRRGFSWLIGLIGFLCIPGFGLLLGFIGAGKTKYTCHQCGRKWTV